MRPADVQVHDGFPAWITWRRRRLRVQDIADHWSELGRWWEHEGECEFFLAETEIGLMLLAWDILRQTWYAKRVQ